MFSHLDRLGYFYISLVCLRSSGSQNQGSSCIGSRLRKRHDAAVSIAVAAAMEAGLIPLETYVQPSRFALESHLDLPTLNAREEVAIRNAADEIGGAYRAALQA